MALEASVEELTGLELHQTGSQRAYSRNDQAMVAHRHDQSGPLTQPMPVAAGRHEALLERGERQVLSIVHCFCISKTPFSMEGFEAANSSYLK